MKNFNSPAAVVEQPERLYNVVENGRIVFTGTLAECAAYSREN